MMWQCRHKLPVRVLLSWILTQLILKLVVSFEHLSDALLGKRFKRFIMECQNIEFLLLQFLPLSVQWFLICVSIFMIHDLTAHVGIHEINYNQFQTCIPSNQLHLFLCIFSSILGDHLIKSYTVYFLRYIVLQYDMAACGSLILIQHLCTSIHICALGFDVRIPS